MIKSSIFRRTYHPTPIYAQKYLQNHRNRTHINQSCQQTTKKLKGNFSHHQVIGDIRQHSTCKQKSQETQINQFNINHDQSQKQNYPGLQIRSNEISILNESSTQNKHLKSNKNRKVKLDITGNASKCHTPPIQPVKQDCIKKQQDYISKHLFQGNSFHFKAEYFEDVQKRVNYYDDYRSLHQKIKVIKQSQSLTKAMNQSPKIKIRFPKRVNSNHLKVKQREFLYKEINFQESLAELRAAQNKQTIFKKTNTNMLPKTTVQAQSKHHQSSRSNQLTTLNQIFIRSKIKNWISYDSQKSSHKEKDNFKQANSGLMIKSYLARRQRNNTQYQAHFKHNMANKPEFINRPISLEARERKLFTKQKSQSNAKIRKGQQGKGKGLVKLKLKLDIRKIK